MKKRLYAFGLSLVMGLSLVANSLPVLAKEPTETTETMEGSDENTVVIEEEFDGLLAQGDLLEDDSEILAASLYNRKHDQQILAALMNFQGTLDVYNWGLNINTYVAEVRRIVNAHPELGGFIKRVNASYNIVTGEVSGLNFEYNVTPSEGYRMRQELEDAVAKIFDELDLTGLTDLEKALAVHDYLAEQTEYALEPLKKGTWKTTPHLGDAYGCLVNHYCVCQGYAEAYLLLMTRLGIEAGVATSDRANHAWNVVKIDGNWYHVDVTHDDPVATYVSGTTNLSVNDTLGKVKHTLFMISYKAMLSYDPNRSDMVVTASDYVHGPTTYDSGWFWDDYQTLLYPYKGNWYSLKEDTEKGYYDIATYNLASRKGYILKKEAMDWRTSSGFSTGQYGKVYGYDRFLFYSTAKEIWCVDLEEMKEWLVYAPGDLGKSKCIFGFGVKKGKLAYVANTRSAMDSSLSVSYIPACEYHTYLAGECVACGALSDSYQGYRRVDVAYHTHIQTFGDTQPIMKNGAMAGTSGLSKRLENITISVRGDSNLGIQYSTHCQTYGWLPWSANGEANGTSGESKRLEAIKIQLTGGNKDNYDVYYRVHAQTYGWLGWAKNGEAAGTAGYGKRLEGIQIVILPKGSAAPGLDFRDVQASRLKNDIRPYISKTAGVVVVPGNSAAPNVSYRTHVQKYGWQGWKVNGQMSGTSGESKRLEGIYVKLSNCDYSGGVQYRTHVQKYGWQSWKTDGQMSGTSGESKRLEAIEIALTGEMANHYDIYYRVHAQTYGWLGWAKNGEPSGTAGLSKRLEGIQIVLVPKGQGAPANNFGGITSKRSAAFVKKTS